jgi:hypothetical protein
MVTFKKVFRTISLAFLIILAAAGAGMAGAFLPNNRERFMDKEIKIEQVDKKREEEDVHEEKG